MAELRPLTKWSDTELEAAWANEAKNGQSFGLPMLQDEFSRRTMEKAESASRGVEEATRTLNRRILWLTVVLVILAAVQIGLAIPPDFGAVIHQPPAFSAAGKTGLISVSCPDRSASVHNGPCTVYGIFHNDGGLGTEIATFEVAGTAKKCQAVIPAVSKGDDAQASCTIDGPLDGNTVVTITSISR